MTLFNNSKLKVPQFKNAKFFLDNSNLKGGIKFAEFEYPKSNKRDIESLGKLLKKISVRCLVDCNKNYNARDKLQKAFDEPEAGNLSLPFYKKFYGYVTEYSFTDSKNTIGIVDVSFEFIEVSKDSNIETVGKGYLAILKSNILGAYEDDFDKAIATVKDAKEKFDSSVDTLTEVATTINQTASAVAGAGDSLGDFSTAINQIVGSANNLVKAPKTLFNNIKIAFDNLGVAFESNKDLFKTCKDLFGIDKKDRDQIGNSQNSIDIRNNQNLINQAVRINALTLGYEASAIIDYSNTQELNNVIADLENGFSKIDFSLINDRNIIDNLQALRYQAINYLSQLRLSVPNVIDYEVRNSTPLTKILFSLYGNESENNKDLIIGINAFQDISNISGIIKVLRYAE